jgi:hypothetical protein
MNTRTLRKKIRSLENNEEPLAAREVAHILCVGKSCINKCTHAGDFGAKKVAGVNMRTKVYRPCACRESNLIGGRQLSSGRVKSKASPTISTSAPSGASSTIANIKEDLTRSCEVWQKIYLERERRGWHYL